jgi:hypothetical protein
LFRRVSVNINTKDNYCVFGHYLSSCFYMIIVWTYRRHKLLDLTNATAISFSKIRKYETLNKNYYKVPILFCKALCISSFKPTSCLQVSLITKWRNEKSCTQNYRGSGLFPSSGVLGSRNTTFRKPNLFPSSGGDEKKTPTQLGPSERANLHHSTTAVRFTQLHKHSRPG